MRGIAISCNEFENKCTEVKTKKRKTSPLKAHGDLLMDANILN